MESTSLMLNSGRLDSGGSDLGLIGLPNTSWVADRSQLRHSHIPT